MSAALFCAATTAQAHERLLEDAAALISSQDSAAAYARLAAQEDQRAGEPRFDYLLGIVALDSGHVTRAIFALERLVSVQPENALARAELGRAYLAAGETVSARAELRLARAASMPEDAAAAIDRVLGVVDQVAPPAGPQLSAYVEAGFGHDSNVDSASNQGEFAIPAFGGILFSSTDANRKHGDLFATAAAGFNAGMALAPGWKLVGAANLRENANRVEHDMNTGLLDGTIGVVHVAGSQSQTVALQNGTAWVGSSLYRTANGLSTQWQSQLDAISQVSAFAQWSRQDYGDQSERNTDRSVLGLGAARQFGAGVVLVYGSAYAAQERARNSDFAYFGHHATGLRVGVEMPIGASLVTFGEWQREYRRYGGTEPFFDVSRRDRQDNVAAGIRIAAGRQWELLPQVRYTRAASNVVLYDYSRSVFQFTARKSFQ